MSQTTARVLELLEILQSGGTRTVADLAGRLGVDQRTVRRYVAQLSELQIPVQTVRGRYGGYRLAPGYRMPPLMLTDEEAVATLLGLVAGRRSGLAPASAEASESALAKLRRAMPERLAARIDAVLGAVGTPGDSPSDPEPGGHPSSAILLTMAEAARDRHRVLIDYNSGNGRRSRRSLAPYGVVARTGRWYVTGQDSDRGEVRTFRLDRIERASPEDRRFEPPEGFDPTETVLAAIAQAPHRYTVAIRVQCSVDRIRPHFPAGTASFTEIDGADGWVRVSMSVERLDWVLGILAVLDQRFVIDGPPMLQHAARSLADRLMTAAGTETDRPTDSVRSGGTDGFDVAEEAARFEELAQ